MLLNAVRSDLAIAVTPWTVPAAVRRVQDGRATRATIWPTSGHAGRALRLLRSRIASADLAPRDAMPVEPRPLRSACAARPLRSAPVARWPEPAALRGTRAADSPRVTLAA